VWIERDGTSVGGGVCGCDVVRGVLFVLLECVRVVACDFGLTVRFFLCF
jgi:hypothetical protein